MFPTPTSLFLTRGVGIHRHQLTAFEFALRDADIEQQNLVSVSSIFPPGCELISRDAGVTTLKPGEVTFCVMARAETNEPGRLVHASIGLARPADPATYGYISEHHGFGMTAVESGDYAEDLAATMLASTLGSSTACPSRPRHKAMPVVCGHVWWRARCCDSNPFARARCRRQAWPRRKAWSTRTPSWSPLRSAPCRRRDHRVTSTSSR
jgi:arginine decarboxylase